MKIKKPAFGNRDRKKAGRARETIGFRRRTPRAFIHLIKSFIRKMSKDKLDVYSAQSAFYLVMAVIPMTMLTLMFLKYTPLTEVMILDALDMVLDPMIMESVKSIVENLYHGSLAVVSIVTVSLLWVASKGIIGLANGLNSIHNIRENRNFVIMRLRAMLYTILLVFTFIFAFALLVAGVRFRNYVQELLPFLSFSSNGSRFMFSLIGMGLLVLIFNMLYVFLPNRRSRFTSQTFGAVFTMIAWIVYSFFYLIYLKLAINLSIIYGGLVTLMVTLLWLYFCLYIFFFGAEINAWRENPDSFPF